MDADHENDGPIPSTTQGGSTHVPGELLFATFRHPGSSGIQGLEKLANLEPNLFNHYSVPKECRIVVTPDSRNPGQYVWTFVAAAKGKEASKEGHLEWPKLVSVLGEPQMITRNRWDEYKCNPEYECFIPSNGAIPVVSIRGSSAHGMSPVQSPTPPKDPRPRSPTPHPGIKRDGSEIIDEENGPRKRPRLYVESESDGDDVEEMHSANQFEHTKSKLRREKDKQTRQESSRVRSTSFRMTSMLDNLPTVNQGASTFTRSTFSPDLNTSPRPKFPKEKVSMETDPVQTKRRQSSDRDINMSSTKRARFSSSILDDERRRSAAWRRNPTGRGASGRSTRVKSQVKESDFWQDVNFDQLKGQTFSLDTEATPEPASSSTNQPEFNNDSESQPPLSQDPIYVDDSDDDELDGSFEEETENEPFYSSPEGKGKGRAAEEDYYDGEDPEARLRRLEESRRKLEEINSYEYQQRAAKARAEQARKKQDAAKRRAEAANRAKAEQIRQEQEQRRQEQERRRAYSDSRFSEDYHFFGTRAPWAEEYTSHGGTPFTWYNGYPPPKTAPPPPQTRKRAPPPPPSKPRFTSQQALDRYNQLAVSFDNFKSTPAVPVPSLDQIPWPVLLPPGFTLEEIDWSAVEDFFRQAELLMGGKGFGKAKWKEFVKNSTRRFHPDRWRARGIIGDKGYGADVEDKVNHVAKVLTPLYRAID